MLSKFDTKVEMETQAKKAVVLLSGGLDSATVLAMAKEQRFVPYAISFRYGQRHKIEIDRASQQASLAGVARHAIVDIDLAQFGGSALTDEIDVPKHDSADDIGTDIPVTYVPARNTVFLSLALAFAESLAANDIFLGVDALDYSGYPDCRPEFIQCFEQLANLATKSGVLGDSPLRVHAPLIHMTKAEIIAEGIRLGVDYSATSSCYDPSPDGAPCQHCDSCLLRIRGFAQNGLVDPTLATNTGRGQL